MRRTTLAAGSVVQSIVMMRRTTLAAGSVVQSIVMRRRTTLAAGSVVQSIVMRRTTLAAGSVVQTIVLMMIAVIGSVVRLVKSVRITLILPNVKNARVEIDTNFTE